MKRLFWSVLFIFLLGISMSGCCCLPECLKFQCGQPAAVETPPPQSVVVTQTPPPAPAPQPVAPPPKQGRN